MEFTKKEDVLGIVDLLIKEINENNEKGKEFDVAQSINAQLPFFACSNIFLNKDIQKDIQRFIYCKDMNVPPYSGTYNEQPAIWLFRYGIIKRAFAKIEKQEIQKSRNKK